MSITEKYESVTLNTRANVFCNGNCVSHDFVTSDGVHKSAGVVLAGKAVFQTRKPEVIECVQGSGRILVEGDAEAKACAPGEFVSVPAGARVEIELEGGPFHYICHYG